MPLTATGYRKPFAASSIWNQPISPLAILQSPTDPETATFRRECTWWGGESVSLAQAQPGDALATWHYQNRGDTSNFWPFDNPHNWADSSISIQTPANISAAFAGGDRNVGLITADGRYYIEGWQYRYDADKREHHVAVMTVHDLQGPGWPSLVDRMDRDNISSGIRAAGGPLLGGLVQPWEIDALSIEHALAIILPVDKMRSLDVESVSQRAGSRPVVNAPGRGYKVGQVLEVVTGNAGRAAELTVTRVDGAGGVLDVWPTHPGGYFPNKLANKRERLPARPSLRGGSGKGCAIDLVWNAAGVKENGRVWPATNIDGNAASAYSGNIPMGSLWTLPPELDVTRLGLASLQAVAYARAIQRYGAYVVDATIAGTQFMALTTADVNYTQFQGLRGAMPGDPGWHMPAFGILGRAMVKVRNNAPGMPAGTNRADAETAKTAPAVGASKAASP